MKVTKVTAFKDNNGQMWETEEQAIEANIENIIENAGLWGEYDNLKLFFKGNPKEVKYILANINKIVED